MQPIAYIHTEFPSKFGIPRQSGLVEELRGKLVFTPPFRNADALRGLETYSHLWLLWEFSETRELPFSPTVRPPRLGGNTRMGVFATRSPHRPNPIGLSCVRLLSVVPDTPEGPVVWVGGADLMDGTPIFDLKPYLPYSDCHPEATGGFTDALCDRKLAVECPPALLQQLPAQKRTALLGVLAHDPRPQYQEDPARVYGMPFDRFDVRFRVEGDTVFVLQLAAL
jgi:tRNA-Thr(GGU) m(6)t(6)A37 methyltransferase TsaA